GRPEYTDPEIVRTNLASVILQMAALGLGDVAAFPFIDPPDRRQIAAGLALLDELGAIEPQPAPGPNESRLTTIGRRLARLPVDPRLGRMLLEAQRYGCVREVMVIAAALSIQDPRESPAEKRQAATEYHRRFRAEGSDFGSYLNLWNYLQEQQRELSSSQFRRLCRREYLNFQRIREWQDLVSQLREVNRSLGIRANRDPAPSAALHKALLAGLLSHIGFRDDEKQTHERRTAPRKQGPDRPRKTREYQGAHNTRFAIGSGSALASSPPRWVMAGELVETNRLWARTVARIEPQWVEAAAGPLLKRTYSEPAWDPRRAATVALERVTLYGVPVVTGRRVDYGRFDPELARELLIRHALVEGDWELDYPFEAANEQAIEQLRQLEDRARRRDLVPDDATLFLLYDQRVPEGIISGRHFDRWYRKAGDADRDALRLSTQTLLGSLGKSIDPAAFPETWTVGDLDLAVSYRYDPTAEDDGVSVHIPLDVLNRVPVAGWDWQVPGRRLELVTALIRSLPKELRRQFLPAAEWAADFLGAVGPGDGALLPQLAGWLARRTGVPVTTAAWSLDALPAHLRITFVVEDGRGRRLATSKDIDALRRRLRDPVRRAVAAANAGVERSGLTEWTLGDLPRTVEHDVGGRVVRGWPGLVDEGETVAVRVFAEPDERDRAHRVGTRRLLVLAARAPVARIARRLPNDAKLGLGQLPHRDLAAFLDDCADAVADQVIEAAGGPVWDEAGWDRLVAAARADGEATAQRVVTRAALVVTWADVVRRRLAPLTSSTLGPSVEDMQRQLDRLVYPGFVAGAGAGRLIDLVRYLKAMERRLDRLGDDPLRDRERLRPIAALERRLDVLAGAVARRLAGGPGTPDRYEAGWTGVAEVDDVRWMLEELRVATWAQSLGTPRPVSVTRVQRALERIVP
ncbi:MAG TPA: ATP-dependent RNA helicase HrpA, partial [Acidimicrobiales bacterium]|nr:ATP-dependent RNA helicase HrpA [Acidimicrobiales bacterium]